MSDALQPYFDAILAAPEDDAPRLELARVLTERGDARGEHIRLACELELLERDDPKRSALEKRMKDLPSFWFFHASVERNFPHSCSVRRGFVETFECTVYNFAQHGERLMREAPIRVFHVLYQEGQSPWFSHCPPLARLRRLRIPNLGDRALELSSPHLVGLRELEISPKLWTADDLAKLASDLRPLKSLRVLSMHYGSIEAVALGPLADLARAMDLELLDLRSVGVPEAALARIREQLGEQRVLPRPEPRVKFRFGFLDLAESKVEASEVRALIDSGEFRAATKMSFPRTRVGDEGVTHFARSGAFPSLVEAYLGGTGITDAGALVLANEAKNLDALEVLDLGETPASRNSTGGVSDEVVRALALSPRLPALRRISRSCEHHTYADGARDDKETIAIARPDGRIVESVIWHTIWP